MTTTVAYIHLTDWGVCLGGEHTSARLWIDHHHENVEQEMTTGLAGRLNKKDGSRLNRPGDVTCRFESEESATRQSVEVCREKYPQVELIIVGSAATADPQPIAWCADGRIGASLRMLNEEFEAERKRIGGWDYNSKMREISDRWDTYTKQHNLKV